MLVVKVPLRDWLRVTLGVELKEVVGHCVPLGLRVYVTVLDTVAQLLMDSLVVTHWDDVGLPLKLVLLVGPQWIIRKRARKRSIVVR